MPPERDTGSRRWLDVLLRRRGDAEADATAVAGPQGRIISCHLRADFDPFPTRWRIGSLHLDSSGARWRPGIRATGGGDRLPVLNVRTVRKPGQRGEWNIKRGLFEVIETDCEMGEVRLAVPSNSAQLVADRISTHPSAG